MRTGMGGSIPQYDQSGRTPGAKALFHSLREIALLKGKTLQGGYGVLMAGTILATNSATGKLVPYITTNHQDSNVGRAYLVADYVSDETDIYVNMQDSYKFAIGDSLILVRNNAGSPDYHDGGAISAIDRTTETHRAKISFTTAKTSALFTTANKVNAYVKSGASGKFSTATFILDQDVDTGDGSSAIGAQSSVLISNAILNKNALVNYDAAALSDLGTVDDGQHVILK